MMQETFTLHTAVDTTTLITCAAVLVKVGGLNQKVNTMWDWFHDNIINDRRKAKRASIGE